MTRHVRSANVLIEELRAVVPDLAVEADDLDGLKVYRTFRLTSEERKGLADVVTAVADNRIASSRSITRGVEVTFTHRVIADSRHEFGVGQVADELITKARARKKPEAD